MGLLDTLWDETLAGPKPDTGLGKLRKYNSFSAAVRSTAPPPRDVPITRAITLLRSNSLFRNSSSAAPVDSGSSNPGSPAGFSTPRSPFSAGSTPRGEYKKLSRKRMEAYEQPDSTCPPVYDWIVMSALDRC